MTQTHIGIQKDDLDGGGMTSEMDRISALM